MQLADMSKLFKTIVYIVGFYYVFRFLARLFLPMLLKKVVTKAQQNFEQHQQKTTTANNQSQQNTSKQSNPASTKKVGEYIDFEEIK